MFGWEMITNNIEDGYPEAVVRALSKGFLTEEHYAQLTACNSLDEFKLQLDETDYGKYIIMNDGGRLDSIELKKRLYEKLRDEIEYLMGQSSDTLQSFMQQMMHYY
jgi:V-type H+-transporting ATPase subunit d